jgi:hypothetical protein
MTAVSDIQSFRAIDIHGHIGRYKGSALDLIDGFYSGGFEDVLSRAEVARIDNAEISGEAKKTILRGNAERLFGAQLGPVSE